MQREPGCLAHRIIEGLIAGRQFMQPKYLALSLTPHDDTIGNAVTQ